MRKLTACNPHSLDGYYEGKERSVDGFDELGVERHPRAVVEHTGGIDISFNAFSIDYDRGTPGGDGTCGVHTRDRRRASRPVLDRYGSSSIHAQAQIGHDPGHQRHARLLIPNVGNYGVVCAAIERLYRQLVGSWVQQASG